MSSVTRAVKARQLLDARFTHAGALLEELRRPSRGWVRVVRESLGMSQADLAARLGINQKSVHALESGELAGTTRLVTLARAADALGCDLVYAIVPRVPLEQMVQERLVELAGEQVAAVDQTMLLEDQRPRHRAVLVAAAAADLAINPVGLWRDPQAQPGRPRR